ncbi:4'-phosphopantetheinyl transferase family protein [Salinimicrobium sediminilitoris]|uniref:4'-phosphopantetheinyl transferase family protein n=1 Tax=Salinimicrobium sediminilitoris TaxID=2876715 RepID=UPI001E597CFC|nr:4'-phosphopantetheinyl transferase superfamily protein [Salinimicrobium sediminilitoris]MCC8359258.1 4'-phosphopantetheinyl transferase superfamily protein [Salinimicrobium sediminilitoris]
MPLYKRITINHATKVLIWKIEEPFEELSKGMELTPLCRERVDGMKSDIHRRGFMSVRHLLAQEGYQDSDLYYDEAGKPHLKDGRYISITHSFSFSGIILSDREVGIDIEKQREKILLIARKFTPIEEYRTLANNDALVRKLTIVWGAKEAVYKLYAQPKVSFLQHINITDFDFEDQKTTGKITFNGETNWFEFEFLEFEGFTCVYTLRQIS